MDTYLFDDKDSIIHFVLGFMTPMLTYFGIFVFFVFLIYEVLEPENPVSTVGDVVEYICGFVFAMIVEIIYFTYTHNLLLLIKM